MLLQTPTAVQTDEEPEKMRARAEKNGYKNGTKYGSLTSQVKYDPKVLLLLTPSASDGLRGNLTMDSLMKHNKVNAEKSNLAEQIAHMIGGGPSQLNPLFTEEMMGFPLMWTTSPFLSTNGGRKVSKHTETPSSHK